MRFNDETRIGRMLNKILWWLDTDCQPVPVLPPHEYADSLKASVFAAFEEAIAKNTFHNRDNWIFGPMRAVVRADNDGNIVVIAQISARESATLTVVCCRLTIGNDLNKRVTVLREGEPFLTTETGATFAELLTAACRHVETWKSNIAPIKRAA